MSGFVYIIQANDYFKIGKTSGSIKNRIKTLQTGCPFKMKLVAFYKGEDYSLIESQLHKVCINYNCHINLEWFSLNNMIDFFETIENDYDFIVDFENLNI
jgi:hypothetical protein